MATPTITPPAAAPAAPASTPSPASAPATSPTPAAQPAAPATPAAPDTRSVHDKLRDGWNKAKETVATEHPELVETGEAVPAEVPAGEETPVAGDEPPAEPPAEGEPVVEPETPVAETPAAEQVPELDDGVTFSAEEMQALEQSLAENPERSRILSAVRRDADNREIRQMFPTKEAAQEAAKGFGMWQTTDNHFLAATTKEGAEKFLNHWVEQAMITDDQGNPKLDGQGKYQFHPALTNTLNHIFENRMGNLAEMAKTSGDERLQAAVDIIREAIGGPSSPATGEVPEELRPYADSVKSREDQVKAREDALSRQQREQSDAQNQQAIQTAETKVFDTLSAQLKPITAKAGLSKFEEGAALEKIGNLLEERLNQHPMYSAVRASILAQSPSDARQQALIKHDLSYMQEMLGPIAAQVIREAKGGALERQTAKQTKVATQAHESRTEPRGTSIVTPRSQPQTPGQLRGQIVADYKAANGGAEPDSGFVTREMFKRSARRQP